MTSIIILFWSLLNNQRQIKLKTHKKVTLSSNRINLYALDLWQCLNHRTVHSTVKIGLLMKGWKKIQ